MTTFNGELDQHFNDRLNQQQELEARMQHNEEQAEDALQEELDVRVKECHDCDQPAVEPGFLCRSCSLTIADYIGSWSRENPNLAIVLGNKDKAEYRLVVCNLDQLDKSTRATVAKLKAEVLDLVLLPKDDPGYEDHVIGLVARMPVNMITLFQGSTLEAIQTLAEGRKFPTQEELCVEIPVHPPRYSELSPCVTPPRYDNQERYTKKFGSKRKGRKGRRR